jgi:hypothetical protein
MSIRSKPRSASERVIEMVASKSLPERSNDLCRWVFSTKITSPGGRPGWNRRVKTSPLQAESSRKYLLISSTCENDALSIWHAAFNVELLSSFFLDDFLALALLASSELPKSGLRYIKTIHLPILLAYDLTRAMTINARRSRSRDLDSRDLLHFVIRK